MTTHDFTLKWMWHVYLLEQQSNVLNDSMDVKINGIIFNGKLVQDSQGPLRIVLLESSGLSSSSSKYSNEFYGEWKEEDEGGRMDKVVGGCPL